MCNCDKIEYLEEEIKDHIILYKLLLKYLGLKCQLNKEGVPVILKKEEQ